MKTQMTWNEVLDRSLANLIKTANSGNSEKHAWAHTAYENLKREAASGISCHYVKYQ